MIEVQDWGLIDYEQALNKQVELVEKVSVENSDGVLIFCTHPAIVTLGRATKEGDVFDWAGPIKEISRGGRATYHGPSQLLVYPIINLNKQNPPRDIGAFLRNMETAIINTLKLRGIESQGRCLQQKEGIETPSEETGVWIGHQKIASLGIGVRKWITYHGAAINLDEDPCAFSGMKPCGFSKDVMTNLEKITGRKVSHKILQQQLQTEILKVI